MSILQSIRVWLTGSEARTQTSRGGFEFPVTLTGRIHDLDLVLREYQPADEQRWLRVRADNAHWLRPWDSCDPENAAAPQFSEWVQANREDELNGNSVVWGIFIGDELVGEMSIGAIQYGPIRQGIVGYWVAQGWAGHDVAPAALGLVSDWALSAPAGPHLHRVEVDIVPANCRSLRVVQKAGFSEEGLRRGFMYVNGQWRDHLCFALLATDPVAHEGVLNHVQFETLQADGRERMR